MSPPPWSHITKFQIQGDFFNWPPPKNHKFKKKLEYPDWPPPKSSKCQPVSKCFRTGPPPKIPKYGTPPCSTSHTWMKKIVNVLRGCDV